jgi:hypothetical protein
MAEVAVGNTVGYPVFKGKVNRKVILFVSVAKS